MSTSPCAARITRARSCVVGMSPSATSSGTLDAGAARRSAIALTASSVLCGLVRARRREVLESRVFAEECQAHGADRPVALLADDDFGDSFFLRFGVVHLVAIDEQDNVRVLLDRA